MILVQRETERQKIQNTKSTNSSLKLVNGRGALQHHMQRMVTSVSVGWLDDRLMRYLKKKKGGVPIHRQLSASGDYKLNYLSQNYND